MNDAPYRICCGKQHYGAMCPDRKVMCCICFRRFNKEDLNTLPNGNKEDVCKECAKSNHPPKRIT